MTKSNLCGGDFVTSVFQNGPAKDLMRSKVGFLE